MSPDSGKVEAISSWPTPTSVSEVKNFLGLALYYRRFIPSFTDIAHPLHNYTDKGAAFVWTAGTDEAMRKLKQALTGAPLLSYPNPALQFLLDTGACSIVLGAVLSRQQEGQERVIAYFSQALSHPECHYCVTRKELLAVVRAIKLFHHYL